MCLQVAGVSTIRAASPSYVTGGHAAEWSDIVQAGHEDIATGSHVEEGL